MRKATQKFIAAIIFLNLVVLGVFLVMPHEASACPFSFLFSANCQASENTIVFISRHLASFKQIFGALISNTNISLFLSLFIAASLLLFSGKKYFAELPAALNLKLIPLLEILVTFFNFLLSWIRLHEMRDPSITA